MNLNLLKKMSNIFNKEIWYFNIIPNLELNDILNLELCCKFFRYLLYQNNERIKNEKINRYILENIINIENTERVNMILQNINNGLKFIYIIYGDDGLIVKEFNDKYYKKGGEIIEIDLFLGIKMIGDEGDFPFSLWDHFIFFLKEIKQIDKSCTYYKCKKIAVEIKYFILCSKHLKQKWQKSIEFRYNLLKYYGDYHNTFIQKELNEYEIMNSDSVFYHVYNELKRDYKLIYPITVFKWKANQIGAGDMYLGLFQVDELIYPTY